MSSNNNEEILDAEPVTERVELSDEELLGAVFQKVPVWPALVAGVVAFVVAATAAVSAFRGGIVFGPWQGAYLDLDFPYSAPVLSVWLARAFVAIPAFDRATCTVLASEVAGALACGILAMAVAQPLLRKSSPWTAAVCGAAAGSFLGLTPSWLQLSAAASPAPVTLLFALTGIVFLQHAIDRTAPRWLWYAGLILGLAAANDPSFTLVFLVALLAALGELGERIHVFRILTALPIGFALTASIPWFRSFAAGESLSEFLAHATAAAFPAIGDGVPRFAFGLELRPQFTWPVLGATVLGLTALFRRGMRGPAVAWGMIFLAMGPFWPALTNQHSSPYVLRDVDAASAMAYAAVCVAAGWGIAWIAGTIFRPPHGARLAAVAALAAALALAIVQYRLAPPRGATTAEALGNEIFESVETNGALVVGDSRTASLLRSMQIARDVRKDVAVLSVHAFEQPPWRARFHRLYAGALKIPAEFPTSEEWKRWPLERPNEFSLINIQLKLGKVRDRDFIDLMLWEFMRDNFAQRPIYFAGVSSPWLTARAKRDGLVLRYPRSGADVPRSVDSIVPAANGAGRFDPECDRTIVALLLPLAEAARRQDDVTLSAHIAELARDYGANDAGAWLSAARAAARGGQKEEAMQYSGNYIRLARTERDMQVFLDLIEEDLRRNNLAHEFDSAQASQDESGAARQKRLQLASQLWDLEELTVLSRAYTRSAENGPDTFDRLYEEAAVAVQLGELGAARERLGKAAAIDPATIWKHLQVDGRFFLLEAVSAPQPPPPPSRSG